MARVLLGLAALLLVAAPLAMPSDYSWVAHTTSESAAQGIPGAWVARAGFMAFGAAVVAIVWGWPWPDRGLHLLFGICMVGAAGFSSRPWRDVPFDATEDLLHSVAATAMGFAFAFGVAVVAWRRQREGAQPRLLDAAAVAASVALPLGMLAFPDLAGLAQRTMFAIAFAWYFAARPAMGARDPTG